MPLIRSSSDAAFKTNTKTLIGEIGQSPHVKSRDQALAIAYSIKRREGRARGGATTSDLPGPMTAAERRSFDEIGDAAQPPEDNMRGKAPGFAAGGGPAPWFVRSESRAMMHSGPINSIVPGRTDRHNMSVGSGSYVIPAQAVSHLGQSNTMAGMHVLNSMFGQGGPYGSGGMKIAHGSGAPKPPKAAGFAAGGETEDIGAPVDVVTAGGEYVVPPEGVAQVGDGDIKHGHNVLDAWVKALLADHVKTLKSLPPPVKK